MFNRNEIELFDNTERDYNEVKKLEIKVCNYSEFEFFRVAKKRTAISYRQTSFNHETGLPLGSGVHTVEIDSFREREQERTEDA